MDLVIVTPPKPPGSSALISPPAAVLLIAPAKVLHGAVRLHGFTSSHTPDTQVREACANAVPWTSNSRALATSPRDRVRMVRFMRNPPGLDRTAPRTARCGAAGRGGRRLARRCAAPRGRPFPRAQ